MILSNSSHLFAWNELTGAPYTDGETEATGGGGVAVTGIGSGIPGNRTQVPVLVIPGCVTSGNLLDLTESEFPHLQNGHEKNTYSLEGLI